MKNAQDSYYLDLIEYKQSYENKFLPEVKEVKIDKIKKASLQSIDPRVVSNSSGKLTSTYDISVSWVYAENEKIKSNQIINKITITFVKDDKNNWYVYELYNGKSGE